MQENQIHYLQKYRETLFNKLLSVAKDLHIIENNVLQTDDLLLKWKEIAPEYMMDAIPNIEKYPRTAIAWAAYVGIAFATYWDKDWIAHKDDDNIYKSLVNARGFDEMDEYIVEELLGIDFSSSEAEKMENNIKSLTEAALSQIRRGEVEPQSVMAFHVFAATVELMFIFGVGYQLHRLGYKYVKVN